MILHPDAVADRLRGRRWLLRVFGFGPIAIMWDTKREAPRLRKDFA